MVVLFLVGGNVYGIADYILGGIVYADINSAYVFADHSQHHHYHTADKQNDRHSGAVARLHFRVEQLVYYCDYSENKTYQRTYCA